MEALVRRKSGEPSIVLLSAEVVEFDGQPCVLTVAEDISERKQAELERTELSRRLMTAQEAERRRIARELHDGIGQSLALLGIQLQRAGQPLCLRQEKSRSRRTRREGERDRQSGQSAVPSTAFVGVGISWSGCGGQKPMPRILGTVSAPGLTALAPGFPSELDNDIALSLLRVVQEALHNVAKHSRASSVTVHLSSDDRELALSISDDGVALRLAGFAVPVAWD